MINIGNRKEFFWDDYIVDTGKTTAQKVLHHPQPQEKVMVFDKPWEGDCTRVMNILEDNGIYRMYYLTYWMKDPKTGKKWTDYNICYAESRDGIHWTRPQLGLYPFGRCKKTNIIVPQKPDHLGDFSVMLDPNVPDGSNERYKGVCSCDGKLWCFTSPDAIHFTKGWMMSDKGTFDSINTSFWSKEHGKYVAYIRNVHKNEAGDNVRDIMYMYSDDFRMWSEPVTLDYGGQDDMQMYTNGVFPYPGAEHIFVGFPARYTERKEWTKNYDRLSDPEARKNRIAIGENRFGLSVTDCMFMTSRDGIKWDRAEEAYITPGPENPKNWVYGDCYVSKGFTVTPGKFPDSDPELSTYIPTNRWMGINAELWRYSIRTDGFISRHGSYQGQKVVTKPFIYSKCSDLKINFSTSAAGYIVITLRSEDGKELKTAEIFGDSINRTVDFENGDAAELAGKNVVMETELHDADIYSFGFFNER